MNNKRSETAETPLARLLKLATERAVSYRESLKDRRVAPLPETIARLAELGGPLPEQSTDAENCWCGGTVWQGQPAMRISVSSWATNESDVERSLEAMLQVAAKEVSLK